MATSNTMHNGFQSVESMHTPTQVHHEHATRGTKTNNSQQACPQICGWSTTPAFATSAVQQTLNLPGSNHVPGIVEPSTPRLLRPC